MTRNNKSERKQQRAAARRGRAAQILVPATSRPHALYSDGTGPYQTVAGSADEPIEAPPQAVVLQQAAEPPADEERPGRELTPIVDYRYMDSPPPRSRSHSLAPNPAEAAEPGDRLTVTDLATEMDTMRSQITRMEDLLRAQTANYERAAAAVPVTPAVAFAPVDRKGKAQEQPKTKNSPGRSRRRRPVPAPSW